MCEVRPPLVHRPLPLPSLQALSALMDATLAQLQGVVAASGATSQALAQSLAATEMGAAAAAAIAALIREGLAGGQLSAEE